MDIFSHGLWAGVAAKAVNLHKKKKVLNVWLAAFWGIFPDLFAFTIPVIWILWGLVSGNANVPHFPGPENSEPPLYDTFPVFKLAHSLYNLSHSLIIFAFVFFLIWLIFRRPHWEFFGWLLHILIDIPTHSYRFFPTPFLWPISGFRFDGFSWAEPWFLILNFSSLIIIYVILYLKKRKTSR